MMDCNRIGCKNKATHKIVLEVRVHPKHTPAIADLGLHVCIDHADIQWTDVVNDEGWQIIQKGFLQAGKAAPKQKYSNVRVIPINGMN